MTEKKLREKRMIGNKTYGALKNLAVAIWEIDKYRTQNPTTTVPKTHLTALFRAAGKAFVKGGEKAAALSCEKKERPAYKYGSLPTDVDLQHFITGSDYIDVGEDPNDQNILAPANSHGYFYWADVRNNLSHLMYPPELKVNWVRFYPITLWGGQSPTDGVSYPDLDPDFSEPMAFGAGTVTRRLVDIIAYGMYPPGTCPIYYTPDWLMLGFCGFGFYFIEFDPYGFVPELSEENNILVAFYANWEFIAGEDFPNEYNVPPGFRTIGVLPDVERTYLEYLPESLVVTE